MKFDTYSDDFPAINLAFFDLSSLWLSIFSLPDTPGNEVHVIINAGHTRITSLFDMVHTISMANVKVSHQVTFQQDINSNVLI